MTTFLFANFAKSTLANPVTSSATSVTLSPGSGDLFPSPVSGQVFALVLQDATTGQNKEITYCTERSGDVCTVTRAQEGTTAQNWAAGDFANNLLTAETASSFLQGTEALGTMATQDAGDVDITGGSINVTMLELNGVTVATNPATSKGDILVAVAGGALSRLPIGTAGQVLTVNLGDTLDVEWDTPFANPMTAKGDLIAGGTGGAPARLAAGSNGTVLTADSTQPDGLSWTAPLVNPMTTLGDIIVGGASGAAVRLGVGSNGFVLTCDSAQPDGLKWAAGFTNPMTTLGDIVVGGAAGAAVRLGIGTNGQVLTARSTATDGLDWETPPVNVITTKGDVIAGGASGVPARLAVGADGQVLTARASATDGIDWETPPVNVLTTKGDLIAAGAGGTPARLAVGTNGQYLKANSAATDGVDWETLTVTDMWSSLIRTVNNETLTLVLEAAFAGTITRTTTQSASGTCTATFSINGTALGGTPNPVSSTLVDEAQSSANTFNVGDKITVTISSNASCVDAALTIRYTRVL